MREGKKTRSPSVFATPTARVAAFFNYQNSQNVSSLLLYLPPIGYKNGTRNFLKTKDKAYLNYRCIAIYVRTLQSLIT